MMLHEGHNQVICGRVASPFLEPCMGVCSGVFQFAFGGGVTDVGPGTGGPGAVGWAVVFAHQRLSRKSMTLNSPIDSAEA